MNDVKLVNDCMAIQSLRDSDFDAYSAYGEVIDNSIQAEADWVKIMFDYETQKGAGKRAPYSAIKEIAFGDNGKGMSTKILHSCMQLGYSSRYNDRSGIGRFGVGMTLGAINQCKRIEVYSKEEEKDWFYTYIDIGEIASNPLKKDIIPTPINQKPPKEYSKIIDNKKGTLVIWKKYDRQPDSAIKMEPEMKRWFGRTFRKFIWENNFNIYLNGIAVFATDPLYVEKSKTEFPSDPPSTLYEPIHFMWPVSQLDKTKDGPIESNITIKISKLNEFHYPKKGSGRSGENRARGIHEDKGPGNEGISILRNKREVFFGHIPYWPKEAFRDMDRWWGCEISFDAVLDRSFTVKNIKRGATPQKELKDEIANLIDPTRRQIKTDVQEYWEVIAKQEKQEESTTKTEHDEVETIVSKTSTDKSTIDADKDINKEAVNIVNDLMGDKDEEEKAKWVAKFKDQPFTILDDSWRGPIFLEALHLGGSDVIKYNLRHPFFETIYSLIEGLNKNNTSTDTSLHLKQLLDILLIAYSKAEAKFDSRKEMTAEEFTEYLKNNWGMYLQSYIKTWRREQGYE